VDKEWGVKSSHEEKLDNSMKSNEEGGIEDKSRMSLTSCSYFTILTTYIIVLGVKIVSWKLWIKLLPTMWLPTMRQCPQPTTQYLLWEEVIRIWYTKLKTKLLESYKPSLDIYKDLSWNKNIVHKHWHTPKLFDKFKCEFKVKTTKG